MDGDERARFCRRCQRNVFHLAAMTPVEAGALLQAHHRNMSVRFHQRYDGKVVSEACPPITLRERGARILKSPLPRFVWLPLYATCVVFLLGTLVTAFFPDNVRGMRQYWGPRLHLGAPRECRRGESIYSGCLIVDRRPTWHPGPPVRPAGSPPRQIQAIDGDNRTVY